MFTFDLPAAEAHYVTSVAVPSMAIHCVKCPAPEANVSREADLKYFAVQGGATIVSSLATPLPAGGPIASDNREPGVEEEVGSAYIKVIDCGTEPPGALATIFSPERNFSAGWSHINDPNKTADFIALRQPPSAYIISDGNLSADASCNGEKTYRAILVKKLHTWNNTHANGLETTVDGGSVGDVESLVVELKLNSAGSVIPSPKQIRAAYPRLTRKQVRSLDKGLANIDLVFSSGELRSNTILTIDPAKYADKWIRITIPMEKMNYYREVDYKRTYTTYQAAKNHRYTGLIINAESQHRKTVQHLLEGRAGAVQLFKELDISIRRIEYVMK